MPGSTVELNLKTAVDSDDNADYLTISLADSLRTLDALFSSATGHNHSGAAHQGGAITTEALQPPIDLPGVFRSTNNVGLPNTGIGLEMYYDIGQDQSVLQSYNRNASLYKPVSVIGSEVRLVTGGAAKLTVQADGHTRLGVGSALIFNSATGTSAISAYGKDTANTEILMMTGLTVTPGMTYLAGVTVNGNATISGTLSVGGAFSPASLSTAGAIVGQDITATRNMGVGGTLTVQGGVGVGSLTSNANIVATTSLQANGGNVYFEGSQQVRISFNAAQTRLDMPYGNGLWATHLVAAGGVSGLTAVVGGYLQVIGGTGVFSFMPGHGEVMTLTAQSGGVQALTVNEADNHAKNFWVNGGAGGTSSWQQVSNESVKADIVPIEEARAVSLLHDDTLGGLRYRRTDLDDAVELGFSANAWQTQVPEAVQLDVDGEPHTMAYAMVIPILWTALREVLARVEALEAA